MNREKALEIVQQQLPEHRYIHTLGVTDSAIQLAERYGANVKKAELAGIFHDYAKYRSKEEMLDIIKTEQFPQDLLTYPSELWHAPVGAYLVRVEVNIDDEEVLSAIRYHTTGRAGMSLLEKVVFLADYIEPNRTFPGVDDIRELAEENLHLALIAAVKNTVQFLLSQQQLIYPTTIEMYNDLVRMLNQEVK